MGLFQLLEEKKVLLADGGLGTQLMERGLEIGDCPEAFNLERPAIIREITRAYLEAGADLVTTNTFGASSLKLAPYGLDEKAPEVNRVGVELAREAVGNRALVAGCMGSTGKLLEPYGDTKPDVIEASFQEQARALLEAGADVVFVETMIDVEEAVLAVSAIREVSQTIPICATMTFDVTPRGFFTIMGTTVGGAATRLEAAGANVVGSNCGNGVEAMLLIAKEFRTKTRLPLLIQSNAGLPVHEEGRVVYPETPGFMSVYVIEMLELGVAIIGGCCGTTPEYIRAFREAMDSRPL